MSKSVASPRMHLFLVCALVAFTLLSLKSYPSSAQEAVRTFPETSKTVRGKFLQYWDMHGGLRQQGYPISEEMQEKSDTDGKTYTVQYFERAVFELHQENQPPYDVLLSLLGSFLYGQKYPNGAPEQVANSEPNARLFTETNKRVGGVFLDYWNQNGALAQQGLPISEEFSEVSALNGKTYKVQYFERAVFELHPENSPPNNVLLSQLGTFRYRDKYQKPPTTATPGGAIPSPTSTGPLPTATRTPVPISSCEGIPVSTDMRVDPICAPLFSTFKLIGTNFPNDSEAGVYAVTPSNKVFGAPFRVTIGQTRLETQTVLFVARPEDLEEDLPELDPRDLYGVWTVVMEGIQTGKKSIGYFKLIPYAGATSTPEP